MVRYLLVCTEREALGIKALGIGHWWRIWVIRFIVSPFNVKIYLEELVPNPNAQCLTPMPTMLLENNVHSYLHPSPLSLLPSP